MRETLIVSGLMCAATLIGFVLARWSYQDTFNELYREISRSRDTLAHLQESVAEMQKELAAFKRALGE